MGNSIKKLLFTDGIALSLFSLSYGFVLVRYPELTTNYEIYELIRKFVLSGPTIGMILILLAIIKLVGLTTNQFYLRRIGLIGLLVVYSMIAISFFLSTPPNTMSVMMVYITYTVLSISLKEGNL